MSHHSLTRPPRVKKVHSAHNPKQEGREALNDFVSGLQSTHPTTSA